MDNASSPNIVAYSFFCDSHIPKYPCSKVTSRFLCQS